MVAYICTQAGWFADAKVRKDWCDGQSTINHCESLLVVRQPQEIIFGTKQWMQWCQLRGYGVGAAQELVD